MLFPFVAQSIGTLLKMEDLFPLETKIEAVERQITEVEIEVKEVEKEIHSVAKRLEEKGEVSLDADAIAYLRKKEEQLWDEKKQLRKKEEQLRKKEEQLRDEKKQLRDEKKQLQKKEEQMRDEKLLFRGRSQDSGLGETLATVFLFALDIC